MSKRSYEAEHNAKRDRIKKLENWWKDARRVYYSDHIFRYHDEENRGYDFYMMLPSPPENKAIKCHTLEEAQIQEIKHYGVSELFEDPEGE